ncbi:uncharacterized protein LOC112127047 [Cimex lectularius]|uniref:RNase H type-1 domain-containing protein n=1 Tax=Cimex lectularius TaxID=79782 RepID=A0A8I6SQK4_CIMLE|nr:uncharacterized protein LOC112127047 [Cimex lectularius]
MIFDDSTILFLYLHSSSQRNHRICLGALNSTPVDVRHREANEPPLSIRRQWLADKYVLKTYSLHHQLYQKIHNLMIEVLTSPYWIKKKPPIISTLGWECPRLKQILFLWVRVHCSLKGNEKADDLAKSATKKSEIEKVLKISHYDVINVIKSRPIAQWQNRYKSSSTGQWYKSIFPKVGCVPWFTKETFERQAIVTIDRLRSNHCICNAYLHMIGKKDSDLCTDAT